MYCQAFERSKIKVILYLSFQKLECIIVCYLYKNFLRSFKIIELLKK